MGALILSAVLGVLMMFTGFLVKNKAFVRNLAITGLLALVVVNILETYGIRLINFHTGEMLSFDRFSLFFTTIALACAFLFLLLSARDMEKVGAYYSEYFALIFFIITGIILAVSFKSLLILFLGIEIISIPLYILTGTEKKNLRSNEASLKYFLMGVFSTGLMLMGITLIYGETGSFLISRLTVPDQTPSVMLVAGVVLLMFSMSFKVSAAPFHFWTPDVYDGAPTVFTSFMATIVKAAAFIAFIRLFNDGLGSLHENWKLLLAIITALTLFIGNISAVFQQSVKRMLAYSSVAQAGFMMMALVSLNDVAVEGILLYATAYSIATIGMFAVLVKMKDFSLDGFNGLARHQPLLAAVTVIFLFSLAGIPLTAGFLAKFYMVKAVVVQGGYLWLAIVAMLMAAVGVYYYFRVIQAMYFRTGETYMTEISSSFKWILVAMAAIIVLLGIFPEMLLNWLYF